MIPPVSPNVSGQRRRVSGPWGQRGFPRWATCFTWVSLTGSSHPHQYLFIEERSLWPSRVGECFPWSLIFGRTPSCSPLPEVVRGTPTTSRGKNKLLDYFLLPSGKPEKHQVWVAAFCWLGDTRCPASLLSSGPRFPNQIIFFLAPFRVIFCLSLVSFLGYIKLCLGRRSREKEVYAILSRPEVPQLLNYPLKFYFFCFTNLDTVTLWIVKIPKTPLHSAGI